MPTKKNLRWVFKLMKLSAKEIGAKITLRLKNRRKKNAKILQNRWEGGLLAKALKIQKI